MSQSSWYMIVYDIADEKRLRKVHRVMKNFGLPVQQSVFFYPGSQKSVNNLLDKIESVMSIEDDDLRAYPVKHPRYVWATSGSVLDTAPLYSDHQSKKKETPPRKQSWLKRIKNGLFGRKKK